MSEATATESKITSLDDQEQPAAAPAKAVAKKANVIRGENFDDTMSGKKVTITIHTSEGDGGTDAVFVSHNGYAYQIPRGTPCKIPVEVAEVIKHAVVEVFKPVGNGANFVAHQIPRFAYSITG